jgi:hypothetical protein
MPKKLLKLAGLGLFAGGLAMLFNKKTGAANRAKVKKVAAKLIDRVNDEVMGVTKVTKKNYEGIVKKVVEEFKENKTLNHDAWDMVAKHLKSRWEVIVAEVEQSADKKKVEVKKKVAVAKKKAVATINKKVAEVKKKVAATKKSAKK